MPAADLTSSAARARQQQQAKPEAPEIIEATFAFVVYQKRENGQYVLTHDLNAPVKADRQPTHDEVYGAMAIIQKDLVGQQYAQMGAQAIHQLNTMMAQALGSQGELEEILKNIKGGPPG